MEEEDSNPVDGHVLTGTVTEEIKSFYTEQTEGLEDYNKILLLHHNLVPQFPMESSLLSVLSLTTADCRRLFRRSRRQILLQRTHA
jgi:hypothetical protein